MRISLAFLLLFTIGCSFIQSLPQFWEGQFRWSHDLSYDPFETHEELVERMRSIDPNNDVTRFYDEQTLDHFDRTNLETFSQRWFVNDTWWEGTENGAPIFLCVGGEGPPLDATVVSDSVHCSDMTELAPKHNALILAIEHRFYGLSIPTDLTTESLAMLSSDQALGDIAQFIGYINSEYGLTKENKWVTWGGSYPGMMSGFARLKYPNLIHASVSSSSPWQAKVNMEEYNNVVASSMSAPIVGGSPRCLKVIVEGHLEVGKLLGSIEGKKKLNELFNFCHPAALENIDNQAIWAGNGVISLPVQSNDPSCTTELCNIESVCDYLEGTEHGFHFIERLASMSHLQHFNQCIHIDSDATLKFWENPSNRDRSWEWQTCTEFGFYATCDEGTECPYTQGLFGLDYWYNVCEKAFNISPDQIKKQVDFSNLSFGGSSPAGWRIMFPNGNIDPWSALGVLESPNSGEPVLMVEGSSHHFWTHLPSPTDQKTVQAAREIIWRQVDEWLQED